MGEISSYPGGFGSGVAIQELPILNTYSRKVFWVDSNGGGGSRGTFKHPVTTLAAALDLCTASKGDIIMIKAGHAEAPTATIDLDVAGVSIIGLGVGGNRPTFTPAHTVASDIAFDFQADDMLLKNIVIAAGTNTGGNTYQVNMGASDCCVEDCEIQMGAVNLYGLTIEHNQDRNTVSRCLFRGTAANPDVAIDFIGSGDSQDITITDCIFNFTGSAGLDLAGIRSSKIDGGILIKDCVFIGMDATAIDFNSSATGVVANCAIQSNNATVAEMIDVGHLAVIDTKVAYKATHNAVTTTIPATTATA